MSSNKMELDIERACVSTAVLALMSLLIYGIHLIEMSLLPLPAVDIPVFYRGAATWDWRPEQSSWLGDWVGLFHPSYHGEYPAIVVRPRLLRAWEAETLRHEICHYEGWRAGRNTSEEECNEAMWL